jgi:hypothetical protein
MSSTDFTAAAHQLAVEVSAALDDHNTAWVLTAITAALANARTQALREAVIAVHVLRPSEHETGRNKYEAMLVYPHVLKRWVADRDAVAALLEKDGAA